MINSYGVKTRLIGFVSSGWSRIPKAGITARRTGPIWFWRDCRISFPVRGRPRRPFIFCSRARIFPPFIDCSPMNFGTSTLERRSGYMLSRRMAAIRRFDSEAIRKLARHCRRWSERAAGLLRKSKMASRLRWLGARSLRGLILRTLS